MHGEPNISNSHTEKQEWLIIKTDHLHILHSKPASYTYMQTDSTYDSECKKTRFSYNNKYQKKKKGNANPLLPLVQPNIKILFQMSGHGFVRSFIFQNHLVGKPASLFLVPPTIKGANPH